MVKRIVGGCGFILVAGFLIAILHGEGVSSGFFTQTYTVRDVQFGLQHHPEAWRGRTVFVRGAIGPQASYPSCSSFSTSTTGCPWVTYLRVWSRPDPSTFRVTYPVWGKATLTYPDVSELYVRLAPGMQTLPNRSTSLPAVLYALPLIGPALTARFPHDGETVLRIHLFTTSHYCAAAQPQSKGAVTRSCLDGIVQQ